MVYSLLLSLSYHQLKNLEKVFPRLTRPCDEFSGRADDGADRGGATSAASRTQSLGTGVPTHTLGPAPLQQGVPPIGSRQNC